MVLMDAYNDYDEEEANGGGWNNDDDDADTEPLVSSSSPSPSPRKSMEIEAVRTKKSHYNYYLISFWRPLLLILCVVVLVLTPLVNKHYFQKQNVPTTTKMTAEDGDDDDDGTKIDDISLPGMVDTSLSSLGEELSSSSLFDYKCPATVEKSLNDKSDNFEMYEEDNGAWIVDNEQESNNNNKTTINSNATLDDFKKADGYDAWGIPYEEVKELLRPWKQKVYVPNLQPGDKIYESACGIGLNLLLTSEIVNEEQQQEQQNGSIHPSFPLTVYGNDYVDSSIEIANHLWNTEGALKVANKGILCTGDSTRLQDFVPSNAFDLAFAGYVDPIMDPLGLLSETSTVHKKRRNSRNNCPNLNLKATSEQIELAEREQAAQEDWWISWVEELIRIAKPGKVVVVENNGYPICSDLGDWGGVAKEFWSRAIETRGWDVDPDSLVMEDMSESEGWDLHRYHVMMRKNG